MMNYDHYNQRANRLRRHPAALTTLYVLNWLFTFAAFLLYPGLLILLFLHRDSRMFSFLLIPGISFLAVSLFRKKLNYPRPYQVYAIEPLISKEKNGESFPSRHVFSIFLIGILWMKLSPAAGIALMLAGTGLAVIRVIGGVHFARDVIAGAALGVICGLMTLWFSY